LSIHSPIGVLHFEFYEDLNKLEKILQKLKHYIQCRVGENGLPFGSSQQPKLWDYADGIDTIDFLISNNK
jgi:hypothetical protein